jgi:hypothetical protein
MKNFAAVIIAALCALLLLSLVAPALASAFGQIGDALTLRPAALEDRAGRPVDQRN